MSYHFNLIISAKLRYLYKIRENNIAKDVNNEMSRKNQRKTDNIKRIDVNGQYNVASEIVRQIASVLEFKIHEDEQGISAYGGNSIRISDHCTNLLTWIDNRTWNAPTRFDIVIEQSPTQAKTQVQDGYEFTVVEFVYKAEEMTPQKAQMIAYDIKNALSTGQYANNVRGEKRIIRTTNESSTIRVTESELRQYIQEAIR